MSTSEKLNKIERNKFAQVVTNGLNDLSDFFHQIKYSQKVFDLESDKSIQSLIYILNSFCVNQVTEIAAKTTFIENDTGRKVDRRERMIMVAQEFMKMQKDMFEAVIDYQVKRNDARK